MRIGVLSDLHSELAPTRVRSWINRYEPEALDARLGEALDVFERSQVDLVLLLGDLTELGDESALDEILARCKRRTQAPVAAVSGNHDADAFSDALGRNGTLALAEEPFIRGDVAVAALTPTRLEAGSGRFAAPVQEVGTAAEVLVLASHYPVLSQAAVLSEAGLPYPRDLVNRAELEAHLIGAGTPTVVVSGHIHARCAEARGPLLQLTVGALIEPPFECTVIEVDNGREGPVVRRSAHRLGPVAAVDPVFTPESECWRWGITWSRSS